MKTIQFAIFLLLSSSIHAQFETYILEENGTSGLVSNRGILFFDQESVSAGYEFPKSSGNHPIFTYTFWFGAMDIGGVIKMAAETYGGGQDLFPGALTTDGLASPVEVPHLAGLYHVSKSEIDFHVANAGDPGYTMPESIENWPAHGDVSLDFDYEIAPFADLNGNLAYEPELGEFPEIRGDHAVYFILNDRGGIHTSSGGDPLGIEIHMMVYQYNTDDFIDSTTFVHIEVINRGTQIFPNFIVGNFVDFDLGDPDNDFIGASEEHDMIYVYNGDSTDAGASGATGYDGNPPAVGVVSLNHEMNVGGTFDSFSGPYGAPNTAPQYWNYLNGRWANGEPFRYGGNGHTSASDSIVRYLFSGDPLSEDPENNWTQVGSGEPSSDRRAFSASKSVPFAPGDKLCYDYAIVATQNTGDHIENVGSLFDIALGVKDFYNVQPDNICDFTLRLEESESELTSAFQIYPNPTNGTFQLGGAMQGDLQLFSMDGRLVYQQNMASETTLIDPNLAKGTYLVQLNQNGTKFHSKLIIE